MRMFPTNASIPSVFGLNDWAKRFVKRAVDSRELSEDNDVYFVELNGRPLNEYTFPDGEVYYEAVQPPTEDIIDIFLALKDRTSNNFVPQSLWSRSEIFKELDREDPRIPSAIESGELQEVQ